MPRAKSNVNALREDNRTEEDIDQGHYRDSAKTYYNPNTTINEAARVEVARAMDQYFKERGVNTDLLSYYFSNTLGRDQSEEHQGIRKIGFSISFSDKFPEAHANEEGRRQIAHASGEKMNFNNANPLRGFKTYHADNENHSANTWEDVVDGVNKQLERVGSEARIDTGVLRQRQA